MQVPYKSGLALQLSGRRPARARPRPLSVPYKLGLALQPIAPFMNAI
jgi:hypothetical protein